MLFLSTRFLISIYFETKIDNKKYFFSGTCGHGPSGVQSVMMHILACNFQGKQSKAVPKIEFTYTLSPISPLGFFGVLESKKFKDFSK